MQSSEASRSPRLIFLIGFMGAGKTTLGKRFAKVAALDFLDLDHYIEDLHQHSIRGLFQLHGEERFRQLEHEALKTLIASREKDTLVACGGGTPCFHTNMELMNEAGISIYLRQSVATLVARLLPERAHRPLIKQVSAEELPEFIGGLLEKREAFYMKAQHILTGEQITDHYLMQMLNKG